MKHLLGTKVQRRNGHVFVKTKDYGMIKEARLIIMLKEGRDLDPNERVFFRDGDRENLDYNNLTTVHFSEARFKYLPHARIIYVPSRYKVTAGGRR